MQLRSSGRVLDGQLEFVLLVGAGERLRNEAKTVHLQAVYVIQACAFENAVGIAGVDAETVEATRFGVGVKGNLVGFAQSKLLDQHGDRTRIGVLQRDLYLEFVWLRTLPLGLQQFSLIVFELHFAHTTCVRRLQVERVFATDDQSAGILGGDDPLCGP